MSDKLICPFCNKPLQPTYRSENEYWCENLDCTDSPWKFGSISLWQELIRTRKALGIAVDALKWIHETYNLGMGYEAAIMEKCEFALEQITALTKGDNNEMENNV